MIKKNSSIVFISAVLILFILFFLSYKESPSKIQPVKGLKIYNTNAGTGFNKNEFGVYIPEIYFTSTSLPLVIASHGAGSNGSVEIEEWKDLAEKYGIIVLTPSYACATNKAKDNEEKRLFIKQEKEMLKEILERVTSDLNIDRRYIMHTGFSGGGAPTWYIATSYPEYFNAFCLRSANFYGRDFSPIHHLVTWRDVPVYILWSMDDNEVLIRDGYRTSIGEGQEALNFMRKKKFSKLKYKIFPEGGHISRREEATRWFAEEVVHKKVSHNAGKIKIEYFHQPGCPECDMVDTFIKPRLKSNFKDNYLLESIDINVTENIMKLVKYQEKFEIPEEKANQPVSMVVNGKVFLNGYKEIDQGVFKTVIDEINKVESSPKTKTVTDEQSVPDEQIAKDRFEKFRLFGVLLAGLLDGINPCVFATLIFFVSLLSVSNIKGEKLVIAGSVYCLACFLAYLALGFGLFRFLKLFSGYYMVQLVLRFCMVVILTAMALVSFRDAWRYNQTGKGEDIDLQLPDKLKNVVHNVMKTGLAYKHIIPGAFFIGVIVTAVESVCTGQVYVPTLIYLSTLGDMSALAYLLLYNCAFIFPLIIIFIATYFGVSTPSLIGWSKKNVLPAKLLMGCFFVAMAVLLVFL